MLGLAQPATPSFMLVILSNAKDLLSPAQLANLPAETARANLQLL